MCVCVCVQKKPSVAHELLTSFHITNLHYVPILYLNVKVSLFYTLLPESINSMDVQVSLYASHLHDVRGYLKSQHLWLRGKFTHETGEFACSLLLMLVDFVNGCLSLIMPTDINICCWLRRD